VFQSYADFAVRRVSLLPNRFSHELSSLSGLSIWLGTSSPTLYTSEKAAPSTYLSHGVTIKFSCGFGSDRSPSGRLQRPQPLPIANQERFTIDSRHGRTRIPCPPPLNALLNAAIDLRVTEKELKI